MRRRLIFVVFALLLPVLFTNYSFQSVQALPNRKIVPDVFPNIQEAANGLLDGDKVFVKAGTYFEHLAVDGRLSSVSKKGSRVIVDDGWVGAVINVGQNGVAASGLAVPDKPVVVRQTMNSASQELSQTEWNRTYGGAGDDMAHALVQTSDGGYAMAGGTSSYGAGANDVWLVKTDASGNALWNKTYGGASDDWAEAMLQTSDGGYAAAGPTSSYGAGGSDFWLVKTNATGDILWNKTYGGTADDVAEALVQTSDGGYAMTGPTQSFGAGSYDVWLVKTDDSGNAQWNKTYGGTGFDWSEALVQTDDGGYAMAGATWSGGSGGADVWLVKTDASGNMQWNRTYGGAGDDMAHALVQASDGGYAIASYTASYGAGSIDVWLVKTDASGNAQWSRTHGGTNEDWPQALVQSGDDGYAIAGYTKSFGVGKADSWFVKTDAAGNALWNRTCGGVGDDWAEALVQTSDGEYMIAGRAASFGAGKFDFWLAEIGKAEESSLVGDVNGDGRVDMKDVGYVARRFMCVPGDPLWDPVADINGDQKINMVDIGTVARHFGEQRASLSRARTSCLFSLFFSFFSIHSLTSLYT
jgi:predicted secreted protein